MYRNPYDGFNFPWYNDPCFIIAQQQRTTQDIISRFRSENANLYRELEQNGLNKNVADYMLPFLVSYLINQGKLSSSPAQIYSQFQSQYPWFNLMIRQFNIPKNMVDRYMLRIIEILMNIIRGEQPSPGPAPGWSQWEDLGGVLTTAPAAASWGQNRIDVFSGGTDNAMWHKWWDGSRWSDWENLGGSLTSAPAAVSWGPNRIDVFARGTNNDLIHKWWDGRTWSNWESLGGTLTSGPTVSSRQPNQLEVFARGQNNNLIKRTWNGSRWEDWQTIGGNLNSEPAAVSWGPERTDVFARGQNRNLMHIWQGQ